MKKLNREAAHLRLITEHLIPEENMGIGLYGRDNHALEQKRFEAKPLDGRHPFHLSFLTDGLPAAVEEAWERFRDESAAKAMDAWLAENNIDLDGIGELEFETVPVHRKPKKSKPQHRGKRK